MERLPFGKERNICVVGNTCPGCNVRMGYNHTPGCTVERCPKCGDKLLHFECKVLSFADEVIYTAAISQNLTREDVHKILDKGSKRLNNTYEEEAAMRFIMNNLPPELEQEALDMTQKILGAKRVSGGFAVPVEKIAESLDCSVDEAHEAMQELEIKQSFPDWHQHTEGEQ